jgi:hypothetical protein
MRSPNKCDKCFEFMEIDYSGKIPRLFCKKCDKNNDYLKDE